MSFSLLPFWTRCPLSLPLPYYQLAFLYNQYIFKSVRLLSLYNVMLCTIPSHITWILIQVIIPNMTLERNIRTCTQRTMCMCIVVLLVRSKAWYLWCCVGVVSFLVIIILAYLDKGKWNTWGPVESLFPCSTLRERHWSQRYYIHKKLKKRRNIFNHINHSVY